MTRELEVMYSQLCRGCKRSIISLNRKMLLRLLDKYSYGTVEKLVGIPRETLRNIRHPDYADRKGRKKSESLDKRTSGIEPIDNDNVDNLGVDVTELTKRLKELGQNGG